MKKTKIKTTERFLKDFPSGVHMLNNTGCPFYYFDKRRSGKIDWGVFWAWEFDEEDWINWNKPQYLYNRETGITYKLRGTQ